MDLTTKHHLYLDIHQAVEASIHGLPSTQEPDYIAALITKLPHALCRILNRNVPTMRFKVGGCFIHQKPLAKFCAPDLQKKSPEIGDLLIVYKEISATGECCHNALLLQAKKVVDIYHAPIPQNDRHQLLLYTKWPKFEYQRAGALNGIVRSINPKTITPGAQYLLIDEHKKNWSPLGPCTFWCAKADGILTASHSLAYQIVDFIDFQTGKPFIAISQWMDHWSKMIWDLISVSVNSYFNRKKAGYKNTPRFTGDSLSFLTSLQDKEFNNGEENNLREESRRNNNIRDDLGGVSILYIEGKSRMSE